MSSLKVLSYFVSRRGADQLNVSVSGFGTTPLAYSRTFYRMALRDMCLPIL